MKIMWFVSIVAALLIGILIGTVIAIKKSWNINQTNKELAKKHLTLYLLMNQWVRKKQEQKELAEYLQRMGCRQIALYGMGLVGETVYQELKNSAVTVLYAIDKEVTNMGEYGIKVVHPEEELEPVDAIIVTPVFYYNSINKMLSEKVSCPVYSIDELINAL